MPAGDCILLGEAASHIQILETACKRGFKGAVRVAKWCTADSQVLHVWRWTGSVAASQQQKGRYDPASLH